MKVNSPGVLDTSDIYFYACSAQARRNDGDFIVREYFQ